MSGLSREVVKWIQSLDLTWQIRTPKWDLSNGFLVAEIFSWYFPQDVEMFMFVSGSSLDAKLANWSVLKNFIKKRKLNISMDIIDGTIHCKDNGAICLIERMYEILTNRAVKKQPPQSECIDFTDKAYQEKLPKFARNTATQTVKNNIRNTELTDVKSIIVGQKKAQTLINDHLELRRKERLEDPERFDRKPTLGELAVRSAPTAKQEMELCPNSKQHTRTSLSPTKKCRSPNKWDSSVGQGIISQGSREHTVHFKELAVNQD